MNWQLDDLIIPLYVRVLLGDVVQSGKSVTVQVVNITAGGTTILAPVSVPESPSAGLYIYPWTHGLKVKTELNVIYLIGTTRREEFFTLDNLGVRIDNNDGSTV